MKTLIRSLAVLVATAGAAAAQEIPPICPSIPAVRCAPGQRPVIDYRTCSVSCVPEDGPSPMPYPRPDDPRWRQPVPFEKDEGLAPTNRQLDAVRDAVKDGDLEQASSGLMKLWSGAAQPKFRKVSDEGDKRNNCTWGCDTGKPPELPHIDWPKRQDPPQKDPPRQDPPRQDPPRQDPPRQSPPSDIPRLPPSVIPQAPSGVRPA